MDLKNAWDRFAVGDHITDEELAAMIEQSKAAIEYCEARVSRFYLAVVPMRQDLQALESYQKARRDPFWADRTW